MAQYTKESGREAFSMAWVRWSFLMALSKRDTLRITFTRVLPTYQVVVWLVEALTSAPIGLLYSKVYLHEHRVEEELNRL